MQKKCSMFLNRSEAGFEPVEQNFPYKASDQRDRKHKQNGKETEKVCSAIQK